MKMPCPGEGLLSVFSECLAWSGCLLESMSSHTQVSWSDTWDSSHMTPGGGDWKIALAWFSQGGLAY